MSNFSAIPTFSYTEDELTAASMNENALILVLTSIGGGSWVEVPATVDTVANTITTQDTVTSFFGSLWAIFEPGQEATPTPTQVTATATPTQAAPTPLPQVTWPVSGVADWEKYR